MDNLDMVLLRVLKHREYYGLYHRAVTMELIQPRTQTVLRGYGKFFRENPSASIASTDTFLPWFSVANQHLGSLEKQAIEVIVEQAQVDMPQVVQDSILGCLREAVLANKLLGALEKYQAGGEISLSSEIGSIVSSLPLTTDDIPFETTPLDDMLAEEESGWGFHPRLQVLAQHMRPWRPGDFGILAARVDSGKTTWLVSELTHMALQVERLFPEQNKTILLMNNEGPGKRLRQRLAQSTLGMTVPRMVEAYNSGRNLWQETLDTWGGREVIQIVNVHGHTLSSLENMVRRLRPAILAIDMMDVVLYDGSTANGGARTDQILEAMYQAARLWAVRYECLVVVSSQLNSLAVNQEWPSMACLANGSTGKPGAADFIAMLGRTEAAAEDHRFCSIPKNKLHRSGGTAHPRRVVRIQPEIGRIVDV